MIQQTEKSYIGFLTNEQNEVENLHSSMKDLVHLLASKLLEELVRVKLLSTPCCENFVLITPTL